ncbi:MAG: hypothetical protein ACYCYE_08825 [Clostridia bacterium]
MEFLKKLILPAVITILAFSVVMYVQADIDKNAQRALSLIRPLQEHRVRS